MEQSASFRTKVGFCHILEDRLVLNREAKIKEGLKLTPNHSMLKYLLLYGILLVVLGFAIYDTLQKGRLAFPILFCLLGAMYLYGWISCFFYSSTPVIYKKDIEKIEFKKGIAGITRGRFVVHFQKENGKKSMRMIMMLGVLTGGKKATADAMNVMKEHQLYPFTKEKSNEV